MYKLVAKTLPKKNKLLFLLVLGVTPKVLDKFPELKSAEILYYPYTIENEWTGDYCTGWKNTPPCSDEEQLQSLSLDSWSHVENAIPVPVWGTHAI